MEAVTEIQITENAAKQIKALIQDSDEGRDKVLRVCVESGGCSGMQYAMTFDGKKPDDHVFSQHGVYVVIDSKSLDFLKGSVIDYSDSIQGSGFRIQNPNAKSSCGCGKSFQ